jgi:phosphotransferase system HPr (HPr) family protein
MIIRQILVMNEGGLHARPAVLFVDLASKFQAKIVVEKGDNVYNAKSIISILSAGIGQEEKITLVIEGDDEDIADKALQAFFKKK